MSVTEEPKVSTSKVGGGDEEKAPLAVAINTENTQFSAGVLGGIAGETRFEICCLANTCEAHKQVAVVSLATGRTWLSCINA